MSEPVVTASSNGNEELYRDVILARERAHISAPLGDESAMDQLAMRDHVVGLEAELVDARARAEYHERLAQRLYAELALQRDRRAMKVATALTKLVPAVARRPTR